MPVYVTDMEDPCLLGLDYLALSKVCNLGRKSLRVDRQVVPLLPMDTFAEEAAAEQVHSHPLD